MKYIHLFIGAILIACTHSRQPQQTDTKKTEHVKEIHKKPGCTFQDTLKIIEPGVIFYQPDSLQLDSIKIVTDSRIFESSMHEYYYQVRNAHNVLKQNWPKIKITDSKNVRFLAFVQTENKNYIIDLDEYNDAYGMFIFHPKKRPVPVDMTNLEDALYLYFSK